MICVAHHIVLQPNRFVLDLQPLPNIILQPLDVHFLGLFRIMHALRSSHLELSLRARPEVFFLRFSLSSVHLKAFGVVAQDSVVDHGIVVGVAVVVEELSVESACSTVVVCSEGSCQISFDAFGGKVS